MRVVTMTVLVVVVAFEEMFGLENRITLLPTRESLKPVMSVELNDEVFHNQVAFLYTIFRESWSFSVCETLSLEKTGV